MDTNKHTKQINCEHDQNHISNLKAESKCISENNDRLKRSFIRNISHEFRTPLNAINGSYQLLQEANLSESDFKDIIANLTYASNRLVENGEKLLHVALIDNEINFMDKRNIIIEDIFNELKGKHSIKAHIKGIDLYFENRYSPFIHHDFNLIYPILSELLSNAINFTEQGQVIIKAQKINAELVFTIKDSGIGIPQKVIEQLYIPFTKDETNYLSNSYGFGIGLYIVKKLLTQLGGNITCESSHTKGTRIQIKIPLTTKE